MEHVINLRDTESYELNLVFSTTRHRHASVDFEGDDATVDFIISLSILKQTFPRSMLAV